MLPTCRPKCAHRSLPVGLSAVWRAEVWRWAAESEGSWPGIPRVALGSGAVLERTGGPNFIPS
jgi:hypothetical protein